MTSSRPSITAIADQALASLQLLVDELREIRADEARRAQATVVHDASNDRRDAYTAEEAAARMGVPYRTVVRLIHRGELDAIKAGRFWLVPTEAVAAFLMRATSQAEARRTA